MTTASMPDSAAALGRLAAERDGDAWAELAERHRPGMRRVAHAILRDQHLAEDACQEALLRLRACASRFTPRPGDPEGSARAWLLRIAANCALSLRRGELARRNRERLAATATAVVDAAPDDQDEARRATALRHLDQLPERHREALALHYLAGLDYPSLAATWNCTINAARVRVHRAAFALRRRLTRSGAAAALAALIGEAGAAEAAVPAGGLVAGVLWGVGAAIAAGAAAAVATVVLAVPAAPPPTAGEMGVAVAALSALAPAAKPAAAAAARPTLADLGTISHAELLAGLGTLTVIDANPPASYRAGHIPGAFARDGVAAAIPPDRATPLVVYCREPRCPDWRSVAQQFLDLGYADVRRYVPGIQGWRTAGGPVTTGSGR